MVGDGSYLMMATELVTAVQEGVKVIVVLVQNHGFASIGSLSEALGLPAVRHRLPATAAVDGRLDGAKLPVDLAANAASLGADVIRVATRRRAHRRRQGREGHDRTTVIHVETDPLIPRAGQRVLVGRAGRRGLRARLHPSRPSRIRQGKGRAAAVPRHRQGGQGGRGLSVGVGVGVGVGVASQPFAPRFAARVR